MEKQQARRSRSRQTLARGCAAAASDAASPKGSGRRSRRSLPCFPRLWRVRLRVSIPFRSIAASYLLLVVSVCTAQADLTFEPSWTPPTAEEVSAQLDGWLAEQSATDAEREAIEDQTPANAEQGDLLDQVVAAASVVDPRVAKLAEQVKKPSTPPGVPEADWLGDADVSPWLRANLRLFVARHLVHQQLYDEAADMLLGVQLEEVVDPSALLFYRMAVYHQIVQPDRARVALVQLLEREEAIPVRYAKVARLVERDLASLEDDSLDHISRRMGDIRRRLAIGRAGARVQQVERGVVESLDKLIEQEEQRRQQQQQSSSSSPQQSSRPMEDSRPAELKGPGRVDQRDIGSKSGWGDLPPKQREQALEQLGREFPVHYRELIEQYFRDLAEQSESDGP